MSAISSTSSAFPAASKPSSSNNSVQDAISSATGLTSQQFMQLLVAQIQNQDPLNPMSDADFAAQLAQFASLQGVDQLNTNFTSLLQLEGLTQGVNLVGRTVLYVPSGSGTPTQGTVQQVNTQNGQVQLTVGGNTVTLGQVIGIVPTQTSNSTAPGS